MDWHEESPKVELHVHLEGAIPHEALYRLVEKYGGDPDVPDVAAVARRFEYSDFAHFIRTWNWMIGYLREYEDFTWISELSARQMASRNIRYAEVFFSPVPFREIGLTVPGVTAAVRAGLEKVQGIEIALICDFVRDHGPEIALSALDELHEVRDLGVIGIGIGGSEQAYPPAPFAPVFEKARSLGFHTTAHAGEAEGARSIWDAIRILDVERIGHGARAFEDPSLLDYLAQRQLPLEMCPISNVRTKVVGDVCDHPIRRYFDRGLLVTVNSDDPTMFETDLASEYRALEECGWSRPELQELARNAVRASWLPEERKREMMALLEREGGERG